MHKRLRVRALVHVFRDDCDDHMQPLVSPQENAFSLGCDSLVTEHMLEIGPLPDIVELELSHAIAGCLEQVRQRAEQIEALFADVYRPTFGEALPECPHETSSAERG